VRKCFKNIAPSYDIHKKILFQQPPFFLRITGLVSTIKQAYRVCNRNRIVVEGDIATKDYIMKPYDLVTLDVRKLLI